MYSRALDEACPLCGKPLSIRLVVIIVLLVVQAIECSYTRGVDEGKDSAVTPEVVEVDLVLSVECLATWTGRYGKLSAVVVIQIVNL